MDNENTLQKKCIACKSIIHIEATLCPICASYQNNRKNFLKFWFPFAGVVVLLFPIITYLWSAIPETFFNDRIEILSFDGNRITLSNEGFGKIYLSHLFIKSEDPLIDLSMLRQIAETLEVGEISRFNVKPFKVREKGKSSNILLNPSDEEWKEWLKYSEDKENQCFIPLFYLKDGATFNIFKSDNKNLRSFKGHGVLDFYSTRSRKFLKKRFELLGLIMKTNSKDCSKSLKSN